MKPVFSRESSAVGPRLGRPERKNRRPRTAAWAALALLAWAVAVPAGAADPEALFRELRKTYDTSQDLSARFRQVSRVAAAGMDREVSGRVVFKKGGKMRWTYEGEDPQELVSDGKVLWIHQIRDRTAMRQDLKKVAPANRVALDLLSGLDGISAHFRLASCGESCLELRPKEDRPDLTRVLLEVSPKTKEVRAVTTEDPLGNRTRIEFQDLRWNTGVEDGLFTFKPPKGVEAMEMPGAGG
jgi:outer membrane lipoprotein carrier protein